MHVIAFVTMLIDHIWHTDILGYNILNCIGRIAFPIFAFMIAEGFHHTSNRKKYILRMFIFALVSEIPFNLMLYGVIFAPIYQNVLWTFLIALILMYANEKIDKKDNPMKTSVIMFVTMIIGGIFGIMLSSDYGAGGVLTVLIFYYFREKNLMSIIMHLGAMIIINCQMISSPSLFVIGDSFVITRQALAILALIPIWLYNGKQGPYNKTIKNIYWLFYPLHMILLVAIKSIV